MKRMLIIAATGLLAVGTAFALPRMEALRTPPSAEMLGLSPAHAAEWAPLRQDEMALRKETRNLFSQRLDGFKDLLEQPDPDLSAYNASIEREVDHLLQRSRALRQRQLAFYAQLSPAEQRRVRAVMADRIERVERLRRFMQQRRQRG